MVFFYNMGRKWTDTPEDEGLSYVVVDEEGKDRVLLRDVVELLGSEIIGEVLWSKYHRWAMFSKFFDNAGPLPHHIHHRTEHAARVGQMENRKCISSLLR